MTPQTSSLLVLLTTGLVALTLRMIRYLQCVQKAANRDRHDR